MFEGLYESTNTGDVVFSRQRWHSKDVWRKVGFSKSFNWWIKPPDAIFIKLKSNLKLVTASFEHLWQKSFNT